MSRIKKFWLIAAIALMAAGCVIFGVAMACAGFEWSKLSTVSYVENVAELQEDFTSVSVSVGASDVKIALWDKDFCRVVFRETDRVSHTASVMDETLVIRMEDQRRWYDHVELVGVGDCKVTVYLPRRALADVSVTVTAGDVEFSEGITAESLRVEGRSGDVICRASADRLDIRVTTGDVMLEGVTAKSLSLAATTGNIRVKNVTGEDVSLQESMGDVRLTRVACRTLTVKGTSTDADLTEVTAQVSLSMDVATGDTRLERCDAPSIRLKTTTGDVTARLLTGKRFTVDTRAGDALFPRDSGEETCEIHTTTGDIRVEICGENTP